MLGAVHARELPWGPAMIVAGLVGVVVFLRLQTRTASPLLDVGLLTGNRYFTLSCLAALGNYAATFGITFLSKPLPAVWQGALGAPGRLRAARAAAGADRVLPLAGRMADRIEPARLATAGMLTSAAGLLLAALTIGPDIPIWLLLVLELGLIRRGFRDLHHAQLRGHHGQRGAPAVRRGLGHDRGHAARLGMAVR
jgi:hypothetical protein